MNIAEAQRLIKDAFDPYIYDTREINAQTKIILSWITGLSPHHIPLEYKQELNNIQIRILFASIDGIRQNKPLQYITGETEFLGDVYETSPGVLIPRPETEELVSLIQKKLASEELNSACICDIGTGSGCIAISLKKRIPNSTVYAIDINLQAIELAKRNAEKLNAEIIVLNRDIISDDKAIPESVNILVSNPPYVLNSEKPGMHPNVLNWEPDLALFVSDDDPLIFYRRIIELALHNKKIKYLFFEINPMTENLFTEMINKIPEISSHEFHNDFAGEKRFLHIRIS